VTTCVALLRAVNVGGHNTVAMSQLRHWLETMGMGRPHTVLQSGNAIFDTALRSSARLESTLESRARRDLGLATTFIIRTADEWEDLHGRNPFPQEAVDDPGHLVVVCLKASPSSRQVAALRSATTGRETMASHGRDLYVAYRDGIGRSRLTTTLIERTLGTPATGRNWKTVLRIRQVLQAFQRTT
jgi:uncharacterized protein (DUF1697 family)